jgi:hypothetical protein
VLSLLRSTPLPLEHWRRDFLVEIYRSPSASEPDGEEIRALRTQDMLYSDNWRAALLRRAASNPDCPLRDPSRSCPYPKISSLSPLSGRTPFPNRFI